MHDEMGGRSLRGARPSVNAVWRSGRVMRAFGSLSFALMFSGCAAAAIGLPIAWDVVTTTIGILQRQTANESLQAANDQLRRTVQALEQTRLALDPEFRTERAKLERRKTEWLVEGGGEPEGR